MRRKTRGRGFAITLCWLGLAAQAGADSFYVIGNSLSDELRYNDFTALAEANGRPITLGSHRIPGATLSWIWNHPDNGSSQSPYGLYANALPNHDWDAMTLQAYSEPLETARARIGDFLSVNRNTTVAAYVYAVWPRSDTGLTYQQQWLSPYTGNSDSRKRAFFDELIPLVRADHPDNFIGLIPVGHVMAELDERMRAGLIPGYGGIYEIYDDGNHLQPIGSYIVAATFHAVLHGADPRGLTVPVGEYTVVDAPTRALIEDAVWDVVVAEPLTGVSDPTLPLDVATLRLPDGFEGATYSAALAARNGRQPYSWTITGDLPPGLTADDSGRIIGTPTQPGAYPLTVRVTDADGLTASTTLEITVTADDSPAITRAPLDDARRGSRYLAHLEAEGGNGALTWSLASGTLPPGITLLPDGRLTGTPGVADRHAVTFRVTDSDGDHDDWPTDLTVLQPDDGTLRVPHTDTPPLIDGVASPDEWNAPLPLDPDTSFSLLWDLSALYALFHVADTATFSDSPDVRQDDAVEVFLDGLHDRELVYNIDDRRITVGLDGRINSLGVIEGVLTSQSTAQGVRTIEIAIPWSNVSTSPTRNRTIGLDLGRINDHDGGDADTRSFLIGDISNDENPSRFGNAILSGGPRILFSDGFDDGDTMGWRSDDGTWSVTQPGQDGQLEQSANRKYALLTIENAALPANLTVNAEILTAEDAGAHWIGLAFHYQNAANYKFVAVGPGGNPRFGFLKEGVETTVHIAKDGPRPTAGVPFVLSVTAAGGTVTATLDGTPLFASPLADTTALPASGSAGCLTRWGGQLQRAFDDFSVTDESPTQLPQDTAAWAAANGLTGPDAATDANPDGDPLANAFEEALALDPLRADGAEGFSLSVVTDADGDWLQIRHRLSNAPAGANLAIHYSPTLAADSWIPLEPDGVNTVATVLDPDVDGDGGARRVEIRRKLDPDDQAAFLRMSLPTE